jgi:hypothetical protein
VITDQPGAATWPISGASFVAVHTHPGEHPDRISEVLKFFDRSFRESGPSAQRLDYVPNLAVARGTARTAEIRLALFHQLRMEPGNRALRWVSSILDTIATSLAALAVPMSFGSAAAQRL